jgi:hypothetical protein
MLTPPGEYKMEYRIYDGKDRTLLLIKEYQVHQDKCRQS